MLVSKVWSGGAACTGSNRLPPHHPLFPLPTTALHCSHLLCSGLHPPPAVILFNKWLLAFSGFPFPMWVGCPSLWLGLGRRWLEWLWPGPMLQWPGQSALSQGGGWTGHIHMSH